MADAADEQMMTVKARDKATGEITTLRVRKDTPMEEIFKQYAEKKNHDMCAPPVAVASPSPRRAASARAISARRAAPSRPRERRGRAALLTPARAARGRRRSQYAFKMKGGGSVDPGATVESLTDEAAALAGGAGAPPPPGEDGDDLCNVGCLGCGGPSEQ